jgi:putative ATP-dependent endonuclease of the OLD family
MDSDVPLEAAEEQAFVDGGGTVFKWSNQRALEDVIFQSAPGPVIAALLDYAVSLTNDSKVDAQICTASKNQFNFAQAKAWAEFGTLQPATAVILGQAARSGAGWFKMVAPYEHIAKNILAPNFSSLNADLTGITTALMNWAWGQNDRT